MKKKLLLMLIFSLLAHITVAGTIIYMPDYFYKSKRIGPSENIIWGIVQRDAAGSGKQAGDEKEKPEIRGKKSEARTQKAEVRIVKAEARKEKLEKRGQESEVKVEPAVPQIPLNPPLSKGEIGELKGNENDNLTIPPLEKGGKGGFEGDQGCNENISCNASLASVTNQVGTNNGDISGEGNSDSLKKFLEDIRGEIEKNKDYPLFARKNGIEGTVYINFHIGSDGKSENIGIWKSSGSKVLDESAIRTLRSLKNISAMPEEIRELNITVPIAYRLTE